MFWKKLKKKATEKHNYNLTYDNVAIPEVHTHKPEDHEETPGEDAPVHYDNVAIPEVHIRRKTHLPRPRRTAHIHRWIQVPP